MDCPYQNICGGCPLRNMSEETYRAYKIARFEKLLQTLPQSPLTPDEAIFIADGTRRRAELTFQYRKNRLILGFNAAKSHEIIDITTCPALTSQINHALPAIRNFLQTFCSIKHNKKVKNKIQTQSVTQGDISITEATNGLDILLQFDGELCLEHRMEISDFVNNTPEIMRVSVGAKNTTAETIAEKSKPYILIGGREVLIPAGTFLQASTAGEQALVKLVTDYIGDTTGNIADLFCGVGTFSYPLSLNIKNKIIAVDSSSELLSGFQRTVNKLMLPNIKIMQRNLFKYPLDSNELKEFSAIVFDPPRAGAAAQVRQIALMNEADKPQKIVAVSCNPHTFINDAATLLQSGYRISKITMVDQFVYTEHFELAALFEKN